MKYLSRFNFKIYYKLDKLGTKLNSLIKKLEDLPFKKNPRIIF